MNTTARGPPGDRGGPESGVGGREGEERQVRCVDWMAYVCRASPSEPHACKLNQRFKKIEKYKQGRQGSHAGQPGPLRPGRAGTHTLPSTYLTSQKKHFLIYHTCFPPFQNRSTSSAGRWTRRASGKWRRAPRPRAWARSVPTCWRGPRYGRTNERTIGGGQGGVTGLPADRSKQFDPIAHRGWMFDFVSHTAWCVGTL